jgi:hypothetical protein
MKKIIAALLVLLSLSAIAFAEDVWMPALTLTSTRSNGLGGPHVAYTDGVSSLFVNPGALQWSNQSTFFELSPALTGPLDKVVEDTEVFSRIKKNMDDPQKILDDVQGLTGNGKVPIGLDLRGPISMGYAANGLGYGFFSRTFLDTQIIGTDIEATVYEDVIFKFGMSINVLSLKSHEISVGFALKPFARVIGSLDKSALDVVSILTDDSKEMTDLLNDVSIPLIVGGGVDVGLQYRFKKELVLGFTVDDVYTAGFEVYNLKGLITKGSSPANTNTLYRVKPAYNVGLAYTLKLSNLWKKAPKPLQSFYIAAMADWHNIDHALTWDDFTHRNPILDLSAGAELGLFNFLRFRVGLNEMLPAVGFGFEPGFFKLNFAVYGKELGNDPGQFSTMAADVSLAFQPGNKKKIWPWSKPIIK